jgi:thiamine-monophosphate kinase
MNELSLISMIRGFSGPQTGDDCAVLPYTRREDLLITTDLMVEDVHFRRANETGVDTGWRTLARGLSDIAAMGGDPKYCLVSLALAPWTCPSYVRDFYRGLTSLGKRHGVTLVGGDITKSVKFTADIVVLGTAPKGRALRRNTAGAGDLVCVSGALGGNAASGFRLKRPEPKLAYGRELLFTRRATACMDLTDGLALDLHRMALASGLTASLFAEKLPLAKQAAIEHALHGGEDYELLFTCRPRRTPLGAHVVGVMETGKAGALKINGRPLEAKGWDPFSA